MTGNIAAAAASLLRFSLFSATAHADTITGGPTLAIDGDTLLLPRWKARLAGIDAPERDQTRLRTVHRRVKAWSAQLARRIIRN